jgi:membrane-bound ClpP family serine protease
VSGAISPDEVRQILNSLGFESITITKKDNSKQIIKSWNIGEGTELGKVAEVKQWQASEGRVFVNGELWRAVSDVPLLTGDKAIVQNVEGLTLRVKPFNG